MNEILIVKCLSDNYAYIYSNKNGDAFVVDPSEAGPVIDVLNKHKLNFAFGWIYIVFIPFSFIFGDEHGDSDSKWGGSQRILRITKLAKLNRLVKVSKILKLVKLF